jgi:dolichol-phosphate mannosyltransferase
VGAGLNEVTVVIPTLNEVRAIGRVLEEVLALGIPRENVVVVDGGSTDGTVEVASSYGVVVLPQEGRGKADAIRTGLRYVGTPYVVVMDGDYTYPARYIPKLLEALTSGDCDLVVGARVLGEGSQGALFRFGNRVLTAFFDIMLGARLGDVLSGMYASRLADLREVAFEMGGFSLESEVVAHFASLGRVCEVPIEYRPRLDPGAKKLRPVHGLRIALDMLRLTWRYNPVFTIFALGALLLIPGLALGAWVGYHYLFTGVKYYVKGLVAIVTTLVGLLFLALAIIALYIRRTELRLRRYIRETLRARR